MGLQLGLVQGIRNGIGVEVIVEQRQEWDWDQDQDQDQEGRVGDQARFTPARCPLGRP